MYYAGAARAKESALQKIFKNKQGQLQWQEKQQQSMDLANTFLMDCRVILGVFRSYHSIFISKCTQRIP